MADRRFWSLADVIDLRPADSLPGGDRCVLDRDPESAEWRVPEAGDLETVRRAPQDTKMPGLHCETFSCWASAIQRAIEFRRRRSGMRMFGLLKRYSAGFVLLARLCGLCGLRAWALDQTTPTTSTQAKPAPDLSAPVDVKQANLPSTEDSANRD